jgi:hypothetical protein
MKNKSNVRKVKAWAIYKTGTGDIADSIFTSRHKAERYYKAAWNEMKFSFPNLPAANMRRIQNDYQPIVVSITYTLPQPNKKK